MLKKVELKHLLGKIRRLIIEARSVASKSIDTIQVITNFRIGQLIVEHEQKGLIRADYGKKVLDNLSKYLAAEFGIGFSLTNLKLMRRFYVFKKSQIRQTLSDQFTYDRKSQTSSGELRISTIKQDIGTSPFRLSWSHYVFLMGIENQAERTFYEIEAFEQQWGVRELKRQYDSSLYERLALSRNKKKVLELSQKGHVMDSPSDLIKQPFVLEFLGLDQKSKYAESDLESAIIDKLENFLLELGKGFLFEARQKRFTFEGDHFYVDLVFYNRLLQCYVLLDLKIGKLIHQDLGQMQMYVNYFDRYVKKNEEHPTVGIILCKRKNSALVEMTLPKEANIYASEYKLYLPSKEELRKKLLEWTAKQE